MATLSQQESVSLGGRIKKQETINFSTAKTTYSFGKDKRFPSVKKPITHAMYDPQSSLKSRQMGFGIGNRFKGQETIRQRSSSPPPGSYTLPSDFESGKPGSNSASKGNQYSFGIGRQYFQRVYLPHQKVNLDSSMPGPGTYDSAIHNVGYDSKKFNMQGKTFNPSDTANIMIKKNVPGPGTYGDVIEINKYGVYNVSTIENTRAAAWSPSKNRFAEYDNEIRLKNTIPPPGTYDPKDYSNDKYLLSSFKNYGTRKMMPDQVRNINKRKLMSETPGPGSYQAPSEFGYLETYKYAQMRTGTQNSPRSFTRMNLDRTTNTAQGMDRPQIGDGIRYRRRSNNPMHNTITAPGNNRIEGQTVHDYMNMRNRRRGSSTMTSNKKRGGRIMEQHVYKPVLIDSVNDREDQQRLDIPDTQKRFGTAGDPSCVK